MTPAPEFGPPGNPTRRPFRRRVALNTASVGIANIWAIIVALICLPLQLRGLGAVAFGTWVLLQTFSAVNGWLSLADVGIGTATARAVATAAALDDHLRTRRLIATSMSIFIVVGTVAALIVALAGGAIFPGLFRTPPNLRSALAAAIPLFAAQVAFDFVTQGEQSILEGLQRVDLSRLVDGIRRTGVAAATAAVALAGGGLAGVVGASTAASAVGTLMGAFFVVRHRAGPVSRPHLSEARGLVSYGSSVAILSATGVVVRTMDRTIVGLILGPGPVSLVEIATQAINGASAVLSATAYATVPAAAWVKARGGGLALRELLLRGTKYCLLVSVPVIVAVMAMAGPLIRTWVGPDYGSAYVPTEIGLLALLVAAPLQVGSNMLQGAGRVRVMLLPVVGGHSVNLLVSIVLVYAIGVPGVFIGTLVGTLIYLLPLALAALGEAGVDPREFVARALLPVCTPGLLFGLIAVAATLTPLADPARIALGIAAAVSVYVVVVWRWAISRAESADLRSMIR